jgi:hypothetical protein
MTKYRDIITEAANRSNIVPRKRDLPADIFTTGSNLLKGIFQEYSNRKYITAYRNEVNFVPLTESFLIGEGPDVTVEAVKIQCPESCLYRLSDSDWVPLNFIAYEQFYDGRNGDMSVSWQPTGKNQYKIYFKPRFLSGNRECKLIYTLEMEYNDNDEINLPVPYIELLTRALAYKFAVTYPRTDTNKQMLLKTELTEIENMLASANSSNRIITRESGYRNSILGNFLGGSFIMG